jgi:hypothetical protein
MPDTLDQTVASQVSTDSNVSYLFSNLLDETTDPVYGTWVDPLTLSMESLRKLKLNAIPYQMKPSEKITTVCYNLYKTTSLWAIILYINGYQHPHEVDEGAVLLFPIKTEVDTLLVEAKQTSSTSVQSKVITF